jgi:hypothetical protein
MGVINMINQRTSRDNHRTLPHLSLRRAALLQQPPDQLATSPQPAQLGKVPKGGKGRTLPRGTVRETQNPELGTLESWKSHEDVDEVEIVSCKRSGAASYFLEILPHIKGFLMVELGKTPRKPSKPIQGSSSTASPPPAKPILGKPPKRLRATPVW